MPGIKSMYPITLLGENDLYAAIRADTTTAGDVSALLRKAAQCLEEIAEDVHGGEYTDLAYEYGQTLEGMADDIETEFGEDA